MTEEVALFKAKREGKHHWVPMFSLNAYECMICRDMLAEEFCERFPDDAKRIRMSDCSGQRSDKWAKYQLQKSSLVTICDETRAYIQEAHQIEQDSTAARKEIMKNVSPAKDNS